MANIQRKSGHTAYPYPAIDEAVQDLDRRPKAEKREWEHRLIQRTDSMEWGIGERAMFRAGSEPTVTKDNERLLRTHHRSLSRASILYIVTSPFSKRIWVTSCNAPDITAGDLEIHLFPAGYPPTSRLIPTPAAQSILVQTLVKGQMNPRKFLTEKDLDSLRILFPKSIGAQVLIAGFLRVLFSSVKDVEQTHNKGYPGEMGGLVVLVDTATFGVTAPNADSGAVVADGEARPLGRLGLKLKFPEGNTSALCRVLYPHWDQDSRANGVSGQSQANNPRGKDIVLIRTNTKVGTITQCFDNPSPILPFPAGYRHDLSLIEGETLPEMVSPPGYLRVIEVGEVTPAVADSVLLGSEYIWDREASDQAVAMLWRSKGEVDSAGVSFGSVLCTGSPTNQHSEAIVFHNYETGLSMWESQGSSLFADLKAGFLLLGEICESMIVVPGPKQPTSYTTACGKESTVQVEGDIH
ncbi:hypothetical protein BDW67DRAFT_173223 [Aspergillus spinulosporus]